jgi:hypothetical protein
MRLRLILSCVACALPAAALGASTPPLDDRDDVDGTVDVAGVRAAHNRASDELVHVVDFHTPLTPRKLLGRDGPPGSVCVNVWTTRTPGDAPPNYDVCVTSERRGREYRASVTRHGPTGGVRRVGAATVEQPSDTRLELRVDPDRIRRPSSYRWVVEAVAFSSGCPSVTGCEDYAPDRPKTARTELGRARAR